MAAGDVTGVRWYEIRDPGGVPVLYQQGTYAPDDSFRWMGSAAVDRAGNIGLGFSLSSASLRPALGYTGHLTSDAPGQMGQGERIQYPDSSGTQTRLQDVDSEHTVPGKQMLLFGDTATRFQLWDSIRSLDYLMSLPVVSDLGRVTELRVGRRRISSVRGG